MARKLRPEREGGIYHVYNRGNYRSWIFADNGAQAAFQATLLTTCERFGWRLHAFCVMQNHFHLAVETPEPNLSEGMRWLQSVFAIRFNRYRSESGHLFQGRFKSPPVENGLRLAWLSHYIHLNPVRAGICTVEALPAYRWSSLWFLGRPKQRPACLDPRACLEGAGGLRDTSRGWARYLAYLTWLAADAAAQKQMEFERMSRSWAIGSVDFRRELAAEEQARRGRLFLDRSQLREMRATRWSAALEHYLTALGRQPEDAGRDRKSAPWKVAIAAVMKQRLGCSSPWLATHLAMGTAGGVSRYAGELERGLRPEAVALRSRLERVRLPEEERQARAKQEPSPAAAGATATVAHRPRTRPPC